MTHPRNTEVLFWSINILFAVWMFAFSFYTMPTWFHVTGIVALLLLIYRIVRGDG